MKGYFRKRGNKWSFTIDVGKDPKTGKRIQKSKSGFKTKKEAHAKAAELHYQLTVGTYVNETNIRFKEFSLQWLNKYQHHVKPSTHYNRNNHLIRLFNELEQIELKNITPKTYQQAIDNLRQEYAIDSVRNSHAVAQMVFKEAVKQELIYRNPAKYATLPKKESKTKFKFMQHDELNRFLQVAKEEGLHQDYILFKLMAFTGFRIGECIALQWKNVDFQNCLITIDQTICNSKNNQEDFSFISPKTESAYRTVEVDPDVMNLLKEHFKWLNEWKMLNRKFYYDYDLVFPKKYGNPEVHTVYQYRFKRLLELAGIEKKLTPHSLRHTHVVMLIESGADIKYIQQRMGHSSSRTTFNIYAHVSEFIQEKSTQKMHDHMKNVVKM